MDSFLSTLPPYVHDFLNKHPPTDVFNLLRELICFAVLYSNDRERIRSLSKELEAKNNAQEQVVPAERTVSPEPLPKAESEPQGKSVTEDTSSASTAQSATSTESKKNMPWTFPDWWGHREADDDSTVPDNTPRQKETRRETIAAWIPMDNPAPETRSRRAMSTIVQPIPGLRSYPEKPASRASLQRQTPDSGAKKTLAQKTIDKEARRMSAPIGSMSGAGSNGTSPAKPATSGAARSPTVYKPGQTATVRARAERAKAQQQKLEEQKLKAEKLKATNIRVRQQAISGIDWDSIKRERRRTLPPMSSLNPDSKNQ